MSPPVVFFDLGQTLGFECRSADGATIVEFSVYPDIPPLLAHLGARARLGVLTAGNRWTSAEVEAILAVNDLLRHFDERLIRHHQFESWTHFEGAGTLADGGVGTCIFVSPNQSRRGLARRGGMRVCPHPALVSPLLAGEALHFISVTGDATADGARRRLRGRAGCVPLSITAATDPHSTLALAVAGDSAISQLTRDGATVTRIGADDLAASADVCMVKCGGWQPEQREMVRHRLEDQGLLLYASDRHLVFADDGVHPGPDLNLPTCGHDSTALQPRLALLAPAATSSLPDDHIWNTAPLTSDPLVPGELAALTPALYDQYLRPWWKGLGALPDGRQLESRHYLHPHNRWAAEGAAQLLTEICGAGEVRLCPFDGPGGVALDNVEADIPGRTPGPQEEIIVVGAHLDSIDSEHHDHAAQSAPGVNDDASGVAAVLAIARVLKDMSLRTPFARRVRFLLFNAEEQRMYGSLKYVADRKGKERIVAMFQLDMIGHLRAYPPGPCEVHSGWAEDESIRLRSQGLANLVKDAGALVSPPLHFQSYPYGQFCKIDGTASDHASFYDFPSPACLVCEDMYIDGCGKGMVGDHPTYHSVRDVCVNVTYASDIARSAAAAVWIRANHP